MPSSPEPNEVMRQLSRILASKGFSRSRQRSRFLTYVIERTLQGSPPKEGEIRTDVFPRYPPESNIVRVIASELRNSFLPRYRNDFPHEPILIDLPPVKPGESYAATFAYYHDPEALRLYESGLFTMSEGSLEGCRTAIHRLSRALWKEPAFAPAHAALAEAFLRCALLNTLHPQLLTWTAEERQGLIERAQRSAETAIKHDAELFLPYLILGSARACVFDWDGATIAFQQAVTISAHITTHPLYIAYQVAVGAKDEAYKLAALNVSAHRINPFGYALEHLVYYAFGEQREGGQGSDRDEEGHWLTSLVQNLNRSNKDRNRIQYRGVYPFDETGYTSPHLALIPFRFFNIAELGTARLRNPAKFFGKEDITRAPYYWEHAVAWDIRDPPSLYVAIAYMALAQMKLHGGIPYSWVSDFPPMRKRCGQWPARDEMGFHDLQRKAIEALFLALDERDPLMVYTHLWPFLDPLRIEPEFGRLLQKMKLPSVAYQYTAQRISSIPLLGHNRAPDVYVNVQEGNMWTGGG
jgi:hypothetical protein